MFHLDLEGDCEARTKRRMEKDMEGTHKAKNVKARLREHVEKKMEEDGQGRKRKKNEKDERSEEVNDKNTMEEARKKRKRGESEDDDVMKKAKRSSSGQVSVGETMQLLRKMGREEWKRKREREGDQGDGRQRDIHDVDVWRGAEVDGDELDPEQVYLEKTEELEFMVKKLDMFGKWPTTTKWVEGWKADDKGGGFVRCRLVGRDFMVKEVETVGVEETDVEDGGC